ncbi:MAG: hypothetical protein ABIR79_00010 [Candidatus Binatia bacterium]
MGSLIKHMAPLLAVLTLARLTSAATVAPLVTPPTPVTPAATFTPPVTAPTAESSSAGMPSPSPSVQISPTAASPSPRSTVLHRTANLDPTPATTPDHQEDDAPASATPATHLIPTSVPSGVVRTFRTPERDAPPAFVAPQAEPTANEDDPPLDDPMPEGTHVPNQPYVGTVTFHAVAATDVEAFDLVVIYPRSAGDFVGTGDRVECRKTGNATMFADDHDDGMLQLLVAGNGALSFPFDIVCRFSVAPTATLYSALIAVNVSEVTAEGLPADPSILTVTVLAH